MKLNNLEAISPVDGRYFYKTEKLKKYIRDYISIDLIKFL